MFSTYMATQSLVGHEGQGREPSTVTGEEPHIAPSEPTAVIGFASHEVGQAVEDAASVDAFHT